MNIHIGKQLHALRKQKKVSVWEMAERYGCSAQGIGYIERRRHPKMDVMIKYLACLNMQIHISFVPIPDKDEANTYASFSVSGT